MKQYFSTYLMPDASDKLLFSLHNADFFFHCWYNIVENKFIVIKEPRGMEYAIKNQIFNFNSKEIKNYLIRQTNELKDSQLLFYNEQIWNELSTQLN